MSLHQILLALHLLFMATGLGLSFSNLINTRLSLGKSGDMAKGLGLQRRMVARFGDGVIALIWVSGLALLWQHGMAGLNGWFHAKMAFVILLTISHAMARLTAGQMMRSGNMALLPRLSFYIAGVWVSAVAAVILAVMAFAA